MSLEGVCADVRIGDGSGIDLASDHEGSAPDRVAILPIASEKPGDRLLCNISHHTDAPVYFSPVRFQFSHRGVIRLSRLRKPRIGQIDQPVIAQLRGINRTRKRNHRCPSGFYPKTHSSFSSHLLWNVTGTVTAPSRPGADFHCRNVLIAA